MQCGCWLTGAQLNNACLQPLTNWCKAVTRKPKSHVANQSGNACISTTHSRSMVGANAGLPLMSAARSTDPLGKQLPPAYCLVQVEVLQPLLQHNAVAISCLLSCLLQMPPVGPIRV